MHHRPPKAFTLIEMLVALTASLILFGVVMTIFQMLGDAVGRSRRMTQLNGQLCQIANVVQMDLSGITARRTIAGLECPADAAFAEGYFEIVEGPDSDLLDFDFTNHNPQPVSKSANTIGDFDRLIGDCDDALFFTTSSTAANGFIGKFGTRSISSSSAEIAYFCRPTPNTANPTQYTLYRRQLLISPNTTDNNFLSAANPPTFSTWRSANWNTYADFTNDFTASWNNFYRQYDLSVRRNTMGTVDPSDDRLVPNTLSDLQIRRHRFAHDHTPTFLGLPSPIFPTDTLSSVLPLSGPRSNEDVIARNVISFDVKVFDPQAAERVFKNPPTTALQPGDRDYFLNPANQVSPFTTATPVFADLGFRGLDSGLNNPPAGSAFDQYGLPGHKLTRASDMNASFDRSYDTWSTSYLTNNRDDDNNGFVDDATENAPYPSPLKAIKITIRLYDEKSREIKQRTLVHGLSL